MRDFLASSLAKGTMEDEQLTVAENDSATLKICVAFWFTI